METPEMDRAGHQHHEHHEHQEHADHPDHGEHAGRVEHDEPPCFI